MLLISVSLVRTDHENSVPEYHETLKRTSLLCIAGRILLCTYRRSTRYTVDRLRACLFDFLRRESCQTACVFKKRWPGKAVTSFGVRIMVLLQVDMRELLFASSGNDESTTTTVNL
jgi:hypothetical protein